jgi:hypothetical protein
MRIFLLLFLSLFLVDLTYGQELDWNVNLHGFADNQEFSKAGLPSPTIFGMRFSPEVGLSIDSTNHIRIGFNSLNEFGDKHNFTRKVDPVIYYNYQKSGIDFYLGAFPRYKFLRNYPRALLRDPLQYFRPNLEGFLFNYSKKKFNQQVWIDWTSRQTEIDRESFIVGVSGTVKSKSVYFSHFFTLWHNALPSVENPDDHIQDNAALVAKLGVDLSEKTFLDSLDINVGGLMSFDRLRNIYDWRTPQGVLLGTYLAFKSFFIQDEFYIGEPQRIGYGDVFYNSKRYNRLDLGWRALKNKYLEASLLVSFHFIPGSMSNQQVINLRYNIGGSVPLKRK